MKLKAFFIGKCCVHEAGAFLTGFSEEGEKLIQLSVKAKYSEGNVFEEW